jgi:signal transduction histidine kinase
VNLLALERIFTIILNILTLSVASGLIFTILIQPRRDRSSYLFAALSATLALWSLVSLVVLFTPLPYQIERQLLATVISLTTLAFLFFTARFIDASDAVTRILTKTSPIVWAIGVLLAWLAPVFAPTELTTFGYGLLAVMIFYAALPFWLTSSSRSANSAMLRIPTLLMALAIISVGVPFFNRFLAGLLLATISAGWIGALLLRLQLFNPINELSTELSTANKDLRQALNDLSSEKARLDVMNRELLAASGYKGEFLTHMSHKLRTPLYSIAGYTELLQSGVYGEMNEKQIDRLDKIQRNGKTLLELINNMLDLSKIEAGSLELQVSAVRVDAVVEGAKAVIDPMLATSTLSITIDLNATVAPLYGDAQRIQQVVAQLLDNALKFTDDGEIRVSAQNVRVAHGVADGFKLPFNGWLRDGDWVVISVIDTGIGVAAEEQAKIFDEFYQVDEQRSSDVGGTGLGLHITKKLVEMHKGVIWVRSQPQQGSTFFVALPSYHDATAPKRATVTTKQHG